MLFFLCKWFVKEMQDDYFSSWYNKYWCWSLMFLYGGKPALTEQGVSPHTAPQLSTDNCRSLLLIWNNAKLHGIHFVKGHCNKIHLHPHLQKGLFVTESSWNSPEVFSSVHVPCLTWAQDKGTCHFLFSFFGMEIQAANLNYKQGSFT